MSVRLARAALLHARGRTAVAIGGIAFAVLLVFMELTFHSAVDTTAVALVDALEFDLMIVSPSFRTVPRMLRKLNGGSVSSARISCTTKSCPNRLLSGSAMRTVGSIAAM